MIANFGTGIEYRARLSSDFAGGRITAGEYNDPLHVSELEERPTKRPEKRPICEATWAEVRVGDVVLLPRDSRWPKKGRGQLTIVCAMIDGVTCDKMKGLAVVVVLIDGQRYGEAFDLNDTVYVLQR
ncbi:MAG TPA: hypothetical protein VFY40_04030 [Blastocatellia bacterium]|nr:hypothetical protein [Blastocatellia bacterium]